MTHFTRENTDGFSAKQLERANKVLNKWLVEREESFNKCELGVKYRTFNDYLESFDGEQDVKHEAENILQYI